MRYIGGPRFQKNFRRNAFILDLRENSTITTGATCIISEKITDILMFDLKIFVDKIKRFTQENVPNANTAFVTDTILNLESAFVLVCKTFLDRRHCPVILKRKTVIGIEHAEEIVSYDYKTDKPACL